MLHKYETIKLASITVDKRNIAPHIRTDSNIIYNYMIKLVLPDYIKTYPQVFLFPDPRSIKVKSANSMTEYLQIYLWFELGVITKLNKHTISSDQNLNIQFADFLAHIVWDSYEHGIMTYRNQLSGVIDNRELFFHKDV